MTRPHGLINATHFCSFACCHRHRPSTKCFINTCAFWLISFFNQRGLYNHALSSLALVSLAFTSSVHTSPCHRARHRNFIFGVQIHIYPPHMHIKYLVILTCWLIWYSTKRAYVIMICLLCIVVGVVGICAQPS